MTGTKDRRERVGMYVDVAAIIIAVFSLGFTIHMEKRNSERFERQLEREDIIVKAQSKPLLHISTLRYEDEKAVRLANRGLGPAIITSAQFCRGTQCTSNVAELFHFDAKMKWDTYRDLKSTVLKQDTEIDLVRLTKSQLLNTGHTLESAQSILDEWQHQKGGIRVIIKYKDIYDTMQPEYKRRLSGSSPIKTLEQTSSSSLRSSSAAAKLTR